MTIQDLNWICGECLFVKELPAKERTALQSDAVCAAGWDSEYLSEYFSIRVNMNLTMSFDYLKNLITSKLDYYLDQYSGPDQFRRETFTQSR